MPRPWTEGPRELINHAADHLKNDGDFDRRIAMISIDNAVELIIWTYLGLPERSRGERGPSRNQLERAENSFSQKINLLDRFAADRLDGLSLGDIEWYHRIRNQLYHGGNGITVERSKVEAYLQIARGLFEALFDEPLAMDPSVGAATRTGEFLALWTDMQRKLRIQVQERGIASPTLGAKREYLDFMQSDLGEEYEQLAAFRNEVVHGLSSPSDDEFESWLVRLQRFSESI